MFSLSLTVVCGVYNNEMEMQKGRERYNACHVNVAQNEHTGILAFTLTLFYTICVFCYSTSLHVHTTVQCSEF